MELDQMIQEAGDRRNYCPRVFYQRTNFEVIYAKEFGDMFRVPPAAVDWLENRIGARLTTETNRNHPLTPQENILVF